MDGKRKCLCGPSDIRIVACSGGSNVGQIANQAAIELTKQEVGRFFCLAGIGAHLKGMADSARGADAIVAIDGCPVQCARKTLEHAGFEPGVHVVVTNLGIEKSSDMDISLKDCSIIVERVKEEMGLKRPVSSTCLDRGERTCDYVE